MAPLPSHGATNFELLIDDTRRYVAQLVCNERFEELRQWASSLEETK